MGQLGGEGIEGRKEEKGTRLDNVNNCLFWWGALAPSKLEPSITTQYVQVTFYNDTLLSKGVGVAIVLPF